MPQSSATEWTDWLFEKDKRGSFPTDMASTVYGVYEEDYTHKSFTALLPFHANSFANCILETLTVIFLTSVSVSPVRRKLTENAESNEYFYEI